MKKLVVILLMTTTIFASAHTEKHINWGYTGHNTPEKWGSLSQEYRECGVGLNQSPINITHSLHAGLNPLNPSYNTKTKEIFDNGHTVQLTMKPGGYIEIDSIKFELKQIHFHSPSENHIEGKEYPMEAHFVNLDNNGQIAVLAIMFEYGQENKTLSKFWNIMPKEEGGGFTIELDNIASGLLPKDKHYYRFNGSLTTPPCTEGVRWFVFKETQSISKEQVKHFHDEIMHGDNNRPIQPIDARVIVD